MTNKFPKKTAINNTKATSRIQRGYKKSSSDEEASTQVETSSKSSPREKLLKSAQPYSNLISKIIGFDLPPCGILYIRYLNSGFQPRTAAKAGQI